MTEQYFPSVSIIIPTYNSARTLPECLASIGRQNYPFDRVELIVADAESDDNTGAIIESFALDNATIPVTKIVNRLKTGEAGKAAAIKQARHDIIALIDSDNILEGDDWLRIMVEPFADPEVVGSEPLNYTHRRSDSMITRYCALIGANDPLCVYLGNYDRFSFLTGTWTGLSIKSEDRTGHIDVRLGREAIPTIGANGFLVRRARLEEIGVSDYFFDIDMVYELTKRGHNRFAKVKTGIIHVFAGNVIAFYRKQKRRVNDYYYYQGLAMRTYPWRSASKKKIAMFTIRSILIIPMLTDAAKGYRKLRDPAWFFHPLACLITVGVYAAGTIQGKLRPKPASRIGWRQ